jgi:hypothetical protein
MQVLKLYAVARRDENGTRLKVVAGAGGGHTQQACQRAIEAIKASGKDPVTVIADLLRNESAHLEAAIPAAKELAP